MSDRIRYALYVVMCLRYWPLYHLWFMVPMEWNRLSMWLLVYAGAWSHRVQCHHEWRQFNARSP